MAKYTEITPAELTVGMHARVTKQFAADGPRQAYVVVYEGVVREINDNVAYFEGGSPSAQVFATYIRPYENVNPRIERRVDPLVDMLEQILEYESESGIGLGDVIDWTDRIDAMTAKAAGFYLERLQEYLREIGR